jgi:hypothetical protein
MGVLELIKSDHKTWNVKKHLMIHRDIQVNGKTNKLKFFTEDLTSSEKIGKTCQRSIFKKITARMSRYIEINYVWFEIDERVAQNLGYSFRKYKMFISICLERFSVKRPFNFLGT